MNGVYSEVYSGRSNQKNNINKKKMH